MADYYKDYNGTIKPNYGDSTPWWPEKNYDYEKKPNVMYIVIDDMGYADLGCYGSGIDTPNIDSLAAEGVRYNEFHVNAMCSPTRASLLSGCNHHTVGMGHICGDSLGFPAYRAMVDKKYGMIGDTLRENGYVTFALGKWHLTPSSETSSIGPFDNWPLNCGFDKFYGFLGACTNQFNPTLVCGNDSVCQPKTAAEGYHLSEDIVDRAITYIGDMKSCDANKPFFCYLAFGALHSPHQAPQAYIDRYKGKFDQGWDKYREEVLERQKKLGIAPDDAVLTGANRFTLDWDSLDDTAKKICAKYMEGYAGFLTHTDTQIGRVLDYLKKIDQLDNTLIVFLADNGASAEGGKLGSSNAIASFFTEKDRGLISEEEMDDIGTFRAASHYPVSWAHASNTPFKMYKSWNHNGGIKVPLIMRWPERIKASGEVRSQYHHVVDINATVLDLLDIESPAVVKGIPQEPKHGVSMAYTFDNPEEPTHRHVQYYEMAGNRGIWADGWKAVADHAEYPEYDLSKDKWELYNTYEDFSESVDLADKYPEKLQELKDLWWHEAGKYGVLPLLESHLKNRPDFNSKKLFHYAPAKPRTKAIIYPEAVGSVGLRMMPGSFRATAFAKYAKGDEGALFAAGDNIGGYAVYIQDGKLKFDYNWFGYNYFSCESSCDLPEGDCEYTMDVTVDKPGTAFVRMLANGKEVSSVAMEGEALFLSSSPAVGVGRFPHEGVNGKMAELGHFRYTNEIDRLEIDFARPKNDEDRNIETINEIEND